MNLREGTRRLALLLGVVGALAGVFASYDELQTVLYQREFHNKFEQLAASDVVQQERKILQEAWKPVQATRQYFDPKTGEPIQIDPRTGVGIEIAPKTGQSFEIDPQTGERIHGFIPDPSEVNKGGIKAIRWDKDYRVESVETEDGLTYYLNPAPAEWEYLLIALFPILGFFIPWGVIRAIGWVGAGFFQSAK